MYIYLKHEKHKNIKIYDLNYYSTSVVVFMSKSTIPALPPEGIMLIYSHEFDHCQQLPEILNTTALSTV